MRAAWACSWRAAGAASVALVERTVPSVHIPPGCRKNHRTPDNEEKKAKYLALGSKGRSKISGI